MQVVNLAQIGCGYWGPNLVRAFHSTPNCKITHLVELSPDRRAFIQSQFPWIQVLSKWETLLDDPSIQGVVIATPAESHFEFSKRFLLAGKHVFVEKPLATNTDWALELVDLAESSGLVLMVGHTFLYNPAVRYLKDKLKAEVGQIYYFYSHRLNLGRVRTDVNAWWNLAPHDISILLYLMEGKLPETISAQGISYLQAGIEDVVFAILKWKNNVMASIQVSWLDPGKVRRMTIVGSRKMIVYDDIQEEKITIYDKGVDISNPKTGPMHYDLTPNIPISHRSGDIFIPKISTKEPLREETEHFLDCIINKKPCLTGPRHGLDVVSILEAGQRSIKQQGAQEFIENKQLILI